MERDLARGESTHKRTIKSCSNRTSGTAS